MEGAADGPVRVVVVEDHHLFRDLVCMSLAQFPQIQVVARYADGASALSGIPDLCPDVGILDIDLADGMNGVLLGRRLRRACPRLGIVLLSHYVEPAFLAAVPDQEISGWSYLLKNSVRDVESLHRTIRAAAAGMVVLDPHLVSGLPAADGDGPLAGLTPRQRQILHLIATGYSNAAIANSLGVSVKTVENQINSLYQELRLERSDEIQPRVMAVLSYLRSRQWR